MVLVALLLLLAGGLWSFVAPAADQPLLTVLERVGIRPELFMSAGEADRYGEAKATEQHYHTEITALSDQEQRSRWQKPALTDDDIRRIASYQQTFNEMSRGERFVQEHLLASARARERWLVSLPLTVFSATALIIVLRRSGGGARKQQASPSSDPSSRPLKNRAGIFSKPSCRTPDD